MVVHVQLVRFLSAVSCRDQDVIRQLISAANIHDLLAITNHEFVQTHARKEQRRCEQVQSVVPAWIGLLVRGAYQRWPHNANGQCTSLYLH